MKARINFTVGEYEDSIIVCGDSPEEIRGAVVIETANGELSWVTAHTSVSFA